MFISRKNWVENIIFSFFSFLHFDLQSIPPPTLGYITKLGQVIHFLCCFIFLVLSAVGFYYHGVKIPFLKYLFRKLEKFRFTISKLEICSRIPEHMVLEISGLRKKMIDPGTFSIMQMEKNSG